MNYLKKSFKVALGLSKKGQDNYDRIFRKSLKERIKIWIDNLMYKLFLNGGK